MYVVKCSCSVYVVRCSCSVCDDVHVVCVCVVRCSCSVYVDIHVVCVVRCTCCVWSGVHMQAWISDWYSLWISDWYSWISDWYSLWISDWYSLSNVESAAKVGSGQKKSMWTTVQSRKRTETFCALISDHDMAGGRTVHAARYGLCRTCCFPGGGYSVKTQELGPLCLKMPAWQTFSLFRPPFSMLVTHNAVACSYFVIKSNKIHVNTYIEFYWAHP